MLLASLLCLIGFSTQRRKGRREVDRKISLCDLGVSAVNLITAQCFLTVGID